MLGRFARQEQKRLIYVVLQRKFGRTKKLLNTYKRRLAFFQWQLRKTEAQVRSLEQLQGWCGAS
eukprot:12162873-Prorocentrum_lima.AAC.1